MGGRTDGRTAERLGLGEMRRTFHALPSAFSGLEVHLDDKEKVLFSHSPLLRSAIHPNFLFHSYFPSPASVQVPHTDSQNSECVRRGLGEDVCWRRNRRKGSLGT